MFERSVIHGLYVITDGKHSDTTQLLDRVEQAIDGGACVIQYRNKSNNEQRQLEEALALKVSCTTHQIPLIINDNIALAVAIKADGVHIGSSDDTLTYARQQLGEQALIGISCYNQLDIAILAEKMGADYVAFGSFFRSPTKPQAVTALPSLLQQARKRLSIPIVAIGGITADNGATIITAGASALAVISGVFAQSDIAAAARAYARLFTIDSAMNC